MLKVHVSLNFASSYYKMQWVGANIASLGWLREVLRLKCFGPKKTYVVLDIDHQKRFKKSGKDIKDDNHNHNSDFFLGSRG